MQITAGYGLVSPLQVKQFAQAVCDAIGRGDQSAAVLLLCETAAVESDYGKARERTRNGAGRGLFQCERIAFDDVLRRASQEDVDALEAAFDFNLRSIEWNDLKYAPLLAIAICRLHYKLRHGTVPLTLKQRAEYWKQHYNVRAGRGSVAHYIERALYWKKYC